MFPHRKFVTVLILFLIVGTIFWLEKTKVDLPSVDLASSNIPVSAGSDQVEKSLKYDRAKEITLPSGFINTPEFKISDLIGKKVILVDFWTYTCINCQRTQPYLNAWYEKYRDKGLEIIGIHTPEFEFEKNYENVKKAVAEAGIKYPVVLDNDYGTWRAYGNRYWPRKYLIDLDGYIVYDHVGEGAYAITEKKIQELLAVKEELSNPKLSPKEIIGEVKSPEIYFGSSRNSELSSGRTRPLNPELNRLYLVGSWKVEPEFAESLVAGNEVIFRYQAKNVFFVAEASPNRADPGKISVEVYRDDVLLKTIEVKESQLYELITGQTSGEHRLKLIIKNPGLRAFTFTFG